jgi:mannose-1-phosphate guanylyltransferase / mannose-6-phosphate isomerase
MNRIVESASAFIPDESAPDAFAHLSVQPAILAGGSLKWPWPLSREQAPNPLIDSLDNESLLEATLRCLDAAFVVAAHSIQAVGTLATATPLLVCCEDVQRYTRQRAGSVCRPVRRVLEPVSRDTAPALTVAALTARAMAMAGDDPIDPIVVGVPADHVIADHAAFGVALAEALVHASHGAIVTLAVPPQRVTTRYGYIRMGTMLGTRGARRIERFVEQPDAERAERYVASGEYWWNSGMCVVRASVWLSAIKLCRPVIAAACGDAFDHASLDDAGALHLARDAFTTCPSDSIDYAVMERVATDARFVGVAVPLVAGWSDAGAWGTA